MERASDMGDDLKGFLLVMGIIMVLIFVFDWCEKRELKEQNEQRYEQGYKDACADFYQGKLKYDLVTNPDGTREWKRVK